MTVWETKVHFLTVFTFVALVCVKKIKQISTKLFSQIILTWCVPQEETAHVASISLHLPLTLKEWGTSWLKSRRSSPSYGRFLVGKPLWFLPDDAMNYILRCWCQIFACHAAYMGFMWMLLLVAYGQRDPNAFFLTQHIRQSFSKEISDSMSIQDVFKWANTTLLSNLFGEHPGQYDSDEDTVLLTLIMRRILRVVISSK